MRRALPSHVGEQPHIFHLILFPLRPISSQISEIVLRDGAIEKDQLGGATCSCGYRFANPPLGTAVCPNCRTDINISERL
jgi:hypothetical protein